ncbi:hypothetical protein L873DRAFT_1814903 [Choiromyces venosus 120613-1]|uniref:Carnitine O-acetyltransferase, mitochondrial n=1 Tax=Choiromyces venosus 120613-1 TaxID=1336337 RepID=A0A3N4J7M1_9PEZI|nr:hypothetical protein L873DRAFT_1814903 [Choiromyces venosus 120613-1]
MEANLFIQQFNALAEVAAQEVRDRAGSETKISDFRVTTDKSDGSESSSSASGSDTEDEGGKDAVHVMMLSPPKKDSGSQDERWTLYIPPISSNSSTSSPLSSSSPTSTTSPSSENSPLGRTLKHLNSASVPLLVSPNLLRELLDSRMFSNVFSRGFQVRSITSASLRRRPIPQPAKVVNTVAKLSSTVPAQQNMAPPTAYKEDPSAGPMLRFQKSLPKLPVPTLQETADRYIKSLKPLLTQHELQRTKAAVAEFIREGGIGQQLQEKLLAKAQKPEVNNWLSNWWNDAAYLAYRDPVVPYVSYFYSYKDDKKRRDPVKRAAAITTSVLKFKKMVDEKTLEPEYMRKLPMCMDSYKWMFNACRIPEKPADYPVKYDHESNKHFVVARKNRFYKVLHEVDGIQLNTKELEAQFARVLELANSEKVLAVGALTSENRDTWTEVRKMMIEASPENKKALQLIESASFVVCLDDTSPVTLEERAHQYWHGDGQNRFFDKPLQFIINENGTAGFMGEHSMMDGTPTHRLNDYLNNQIFNNKIDFSAGDVRSNLPEPAPINFELNEDVVGAIDKAQQNFRDVIGLHELKVLAYLGYGKGLIKKFKCSPDAYVQMVIQLAYYKMYGKNRPTYESAATRKFQEGRTETCRTVSEESVEWCKSMMDPDVDPKACISKFRAAINAHVAYISAASEGKGVDRHLFGLKKLLPPGAEFPEIYTDPAYGYSSSWFLSTSQLSSEYFNGYGWSQVIDQGYGIAYMINENTLQFNVVSKKQGCDRMQFYLTDAANEIRELMESELETKAKL